MVDPKSEQHERRLVRIETELAYQDKLIADLNDVLVAHSQSIDRLARRVQTLEQQLEALLGEQGQPVEKPPHY